MRAAVIAEPGTTTVERVDDPTPGASEVVVEVDSCGICGTDLHLIDGEFPTTYPLVPGHEFGGRVVALGRDVEGLAEGDAVSVDPSLHCGHCHYCLLGRGNLCENWAAIGVTTAGGCAQFAAVPARNAYAVPAELPGGHSALIEPLSCAVHGFDVLGITLGDHYLVYGAGTMGLLMVQLAARSGSGSVSVVDTNADRLPRALELGADHVATSADELDRPTGWEVVVDATGVVAAIEDGVRRVRRGGSFLMFGVASEDAEAKISPFRVYNDEIRIVGSMAVLHSYERARDLLVGGAIDAEAILTHHLPLDDYDAAIETFRRGEGLKVQIRPGAAS